MFLQSYKLYLEISGFLGQPKLKDLKKNETSSIYISFYCFLRKCRPWFFMNFQLQPNMSCICCYPGTTSFREEDPFCLTSNRVRPHVLCNDRIRRIKHPWNDRKIWSNEHLIIWFWYVIHEFSGNKSNGCSVMLVGNGDSCRWIFFFHQSGRALIISWILAGKRGCMFMCLT